MFAFMALVMVLTGCNGGVKGALGVEELPKLDSEACIAKAKEGLSQLDMKRYKVINVSMSEKGVDEMSNELGSISYSLVDQDGRLYSQNFSYWESERKWRFDDPTPSRIQKVPLDFEKVHGITEADLDAKKMLGFFVAAKNQIPKEYTYKGLTSITLKYGTPNPLIGEGKYGDKIQISFSAMATENGKETVESAGKSTKVFYKASFEVNEKGEVVLN